MVILDTTLVKGNSTVQFIVFPYFRIFIRRDRFTGKERNNYCLVSSNSNHRSLSLYGTYGVGRGRVTYPDGTRLVPLPLLQSSPVPYLLVPPTSRIPCPIKKTPPPLSLVTGSTGKKTHYYYSSTVGTILRDHRQN